MNPVGPTTTRYEVCVVTDVPGVNVHDTDGLDVFVLVTVIDVAFGRAVAVTRNPNGVTDATRFPSVRTVHWYSVSKSAHIPAGNVSDVAVDGAVHTS